MVKLKELKLLEMSGIVKNHRKFQYLLLGLILILVTNIHFASAHLEGVPYYNGGGGQAGSYWVNTSVEPYFASPGVPVEIVFSIQTEFGEHIHDMYTMIEIYDSITEQRVFLQPWTHRPISDFTLEHTFDKSGSYQIVLSMSEDAKTINDVPQRNILLDNSNCDCHRIVSNIVVNENYGMIWNFIMSIVVILPTVTFGFALYVNYKRSSKRWKNTTIGKLETARYLVMITAIASGLVHFIVYAQHASMRLEWSLFLFMAASLQMTYGVYFLLMTMKNSAKLKTKIKKVTSSDSRILLKYLQTPLKTHLIGIIGSLSLIMLYIYVVVFPAPLAPSNLPEDISILGLLSKTTESLMIFSILWLIILERRVKRFLNQL